MIIRSSTRTAETNARAKRHVLNAGCGVNTEGKLHAAFRLPEWQETRLDIDQQVAPDVLSSLTDMNELADESFDAVWCSHSLEHLHAHDVPVALAEFRRVLTSDGFGLVTTPDLEALAELVVSGRLETVAYRAPVGPITALDMIYGHAGSIQKGSTFMAHNTGFTVDRMGRLLIDAGFAEALVIKGQKFDLWGLALMPAADKENILACMHAAGLDFYPDG